LHASTNFIQTTAGPVTIATTANKALPSLETLLRTPMLTCQISRQMKQGQKW